MKEKLLIIDKRQFGYLTDSYKWCEYLKDEYDITYLCFDAGYEKVKLTGVDVCYVYYKLPLLLRAMLFVITAIIKVSTFRGKILVIYYPSCSLLKKFFPKKKIHVDIRTLSVNVDEKERRLYDERLIRECACFDSISVISGGIAKKSGLQNVKILPLGSDIISAAKKVYDNEMRLLYVGTLRNRNLEQTIEGLKLFLAKTSDMELHYDIVGDGYPGQLDELKNKTKTLGLERYITFHGMIPHGELKRFFDCSNIGISYVPITDYYENQPPTKTYEYALSGLFCIATGTDANKELINCDNGVIIKDTPESFCEGLEYFISVKGQLEENKIRRSLEFGLWKNIVNKRMKPIIETL